MANEGMRLSEAGWTALRIREHAIMAYYNDQANNCTYGVGTLAHYGPCTLHPRDANGRRLAPVRSNGLVNRRRLETAPFRRQQGGQ
ncbi:hypothetical protein [Burkholderia guangdongensis]|uniref:hypothetical protein n=1 Tax=Burkholderia guangdongensis TaxID=1792500 RepID=UPI0031B5ED53